MEFEIHDWLKTLQDKVFSIFPGRVLFFGFQGSYRRGEASPQSDVDVVLILDQVELIDLKKYREAIRSMTHSEKACGFISGKKEISNWSKADLFQFIYDTQAIHGKLEDLITPLTQADIQRAVKTGSEMLYHGACHCFLYDMNIAESLGALFKNTFFILQADHFLKTGEYVSTQKLLLEKLTGLDREILEACVNRASIVGYDSQQVDELYAKLIVWCGRKITE